MHGAEAGMQPADVGMQGAEAQLQAEAVRLRVGHICLRGADGKNRLEPARTIAAFAALSRHFCVSVTDRDRSRKVVPIFDDAARGVLMNGAYIQLIQTASSRTGSVLYERETGRPMARVASSA